MLRAVEVFIKVTTDLSLIDNHHQQQNTEIYTEPK